MTIGIQSAHVNLQSCGGVGLQRYKEIFYAYGHAKKNATKKDACWTVVLFCSHSLELKVMSLWF